MDIQALINGMNAQWQRERSETQMTLGRLIAALEEMQEGSEVANISDAHSYRGYYTDLAFEQGHGTRPAIGLLSECKNAMGRVFCGYKGGDFVMGELTPVWIAFYGSTGKKLIAINNDGTIETADDED